MGDIFTSVLAMLWKQAECWSFDSRPTVCCSLDGLKMAMACGSTITLFDHTTTQQISINPLNADYLFSLSFSPDSTRLACGSHSNTVLLFDTSSGEVLADLNAEITTTNVCFSPDGRLIYVVDGNGRYVVLNVSSGKLLEMEFVPESRQICFPTDGNIMVIKCKDKLVVMKRGSEPRTIDCGGICSVAVSSDGGRIIAGLENGEIRVLDTSSGQTIKTLRAHQDWVNTVCIVSDGMWFVSGSMDETIKVWDANTFECVQMITDHNDAIGVVCCGANNSFVSSGADKTVRLWECSS